MQDIYSNSQDIYSDDPENFDEYDEDEDFEEPSAPEPEQDEPEPEEEPRIGGIDLVRAVCIAVTIPLLLLRQLDQFVGLSFSFLPTNRLEFIQTIVAAVAIFTSGVCCYLSHDNLTRGVRLFLAGWLVTLATGWFTPAYQVRFGILTLLGACCILYYFVGPYLEKIHTLPVLALYCFALAITMPMTDGYFGIWGISLPESITSRGVLLPLGFSQGTADDYSLLPWLFVFLCGTLLGRLREGKWSRWFRELGGEGTRWLSRHALALFLLCQPLWYGVCRLILSLRS